MKPGLVVEGSPALARSILVERLHLWHLLCISPALNAVLPYLPPVGYPDQILDGQDDIISTAAQPTEKLAPAASPVIGYFRSMVSFHGV